MISDDHGHFWIDTSRTLRMDAVRAADSGHSGSPIGMTPTAHVLRHCFVFVDRIIRDNHGPFELSVGNCLTLLYALLVALSCALVRADDERAGVPRTEKSSTAHVSRVTLGRCVARTANFQIWWCTSDANLRQLAETSELLVSGARERWLGASLAPAWTPKCDVVVHRSKSEYVACLGHGSERTSGCATIQIEEGRVVLRRIDLRLDASDWRADTLPHELMHVVLADRFSRRRIPPWADEGIAMLCESPENLKRRLDRLRRVASQGVLYSVQDLIHVRSRPQAASLDAFNGQSIAMVSLLLERGTRQQCLEFVEASHEKDWKAALRDVYSERSSDLERSMSDYVRTDRE